MAQHHSMFAHWMQTIDVVCHRQIFFGLEMRFAAIDALTKMPSVMRMMILVVFGLLPADDSVAFGFHLVIFSFELLLRPSELTLAVACIGILWRENCEEKREVCLAIVSRNTRKRLDAPLAPCRMERLKKYKIKRNEYEAD